MRTVYSTVFMAFPDLYYVRDDRYENYHEGGTLDQERRWQGTHPSILRLSSHSIRQPHEKASEMAESHLVSRATGLFHQGAMREMHSTR